MFCIKFISRENMLCFVMRPSVGYQTIMYEVISPFILHYVRHSKTIHCMCVLYDIVLTDVVDDVKT